MVIPHTRCAMAAADDDVIIERDPAEQRRGRLLGALRRLRRPAAHAAPGRGQLRNHPQIAGRAPVGGFFYDVDTGLLERWV